MSGVYRSEQNNVYASGYAPVTAMILRPGPSMPAANCPAKNIEFMQQQMSKEQNAAMVYGSNPGYSSLMSGYGPAPTVAYAAKYFNPETFQEDITPTDNVFRYTIQ
jgi:hypothetical protein